MKWYYLASLIWVTRLLLFVTIIGIPLVMYLMDNNEWFEAPFNCAYCTNKENKYE